VFATERDPVAGAERSDPVAEATRGRERDGSERRVVGGRPVVGRPVVGRPVAGDLDVDVSAAPRLGRAGDDARDSISRAVAEVPDLSGREVRVGALVR